jgi:hypothetical protein
MMPPGWTSYTLSPLLRHQEFDRLVRMSLTFGLQTPRDLFEKLKRDGNLLDEEVTSDHFFNFVVTGYSLIDWLKHEPSIPQTAVQKMYADHWIKICGDLATASKHFKLTTRKNPITADAKSDFHGYGLARYGKGRYGSGEESIQVELNDGSTLSALDLMQNVIQTWDSFFQLHGL